MTRKGTDVGRIAEHTNEAIAPTSDTSMSLPYINQIEEYARYLKAHGRTETTIKNNRKSLTNFFKKVHINSMDELTEERIRYFINNSGLKESSVKKYLINLDTMFYALRKEHPVKDMNILWNRSNYYRLFIEKEDFVKILHHTEDRRTRMILAFGAYMGLRTIELERMLVKDIKDNRIYVRGKGHGCGYSDDMPIPDVIREELNSYLQWRQQQGVKIPYMFFIEKSGVFYPIGEGSNIIYNLIKRAGEKAGVKVTPHALRRLFATTLYYDLGTDLVTVKELLRHSSSATTMDNYIKCYPKYKLSAMDRLTTLYTHNCNSRPTPL